MIDFGTFFVVLRGQSTPHFITFHHPNNTASFLYRENQHLTDIFTQFIIII